jgi:hypothetical protein
VGHGALRQRGEARSREGMRRSGFADVASIGALVPNRLSEDGCGRAGARGIPLLLCSISAKGKREGAGWG